MKYPFYLIVGEIKWYIKYRNRTNKVPKSPIGQYNTIIGIKKDVRLLNKYRWSAKGLKYVYG